MTYPDKALSIRQPWAEMILSGKKTIEIRPWVTGHRGEVWLHVSQKKDVELEQSFGYHSLPTGVYTGLFSIMAVVPLTPQRWEEWRSRHLDPGPYVYGNYAWFVGDAVRFGNPVPGGGQLRLFEPDFQMLERLKAALRPG